jgi:hypothetical protein
MLLESSIAWLAVALLSVCMISQWHRDNARPVIMLLCQGFENSIGVARRIDTA